MKSDDGGDEKMNSEIRRGKMVLLQGDLTKQDVDAIVNAANSGLRGGGGVDGAIHRAGGPSIDEECRDIISRIGRLETGKAVITSGGNLKARYIIHTVGPVWHGGDHGEEGLLADAYRNSIKLAEEKGLQTIAFPNISTGIFGFPKELAAETAYTAVKEALEACEEIEEVRFVCFDDENFGLYRELMGKDKI
ncbi:MAG: macro domain, ADP-ribose binding module [Firmicutes bacterium]|nr:macro domain, ADP-ribose binding module [Bacillota bacterium]